MAVSIQIAKFKLRQDQWRANSPNLMLAKVIRYTVAAAIPRAGVPEATVQLSVVF